MSALDAGDYADSFSAALRLEDLGRPRTLQTEGGQLGASDAGQCVRKAVYTVTQATPTDVPKKGKAQSGTYLHAGTLAAVQALYPQRIIEAELQVTLPSGAQIMVHPDEINPDEPSVTDYKFTGSFALIERKGSSDAQKMQRALQYLAALQNGIITTDKGIVRNLFVDMTDLDNTFVDQEPFSMDWIHAADDWYQSVIYAVSNGEEGERGWPYPMCKDFCPFVSRCRPPVPELSQPITNIDLAATVLLTHEARLERKAAERVEKAGVEILKGLSGTAHGIQVTSTVVNAERPYTKVEMREVR